MPASHPRLIAIALIAIFAAAGHAHDSWVQVDRNVVRLADVVHVSLMLGNHGNDHRDFRLAGKMKLEPSTLTLIAPDGQVTDLKPSLTDQGLSETEGYWTTSFRAKDTGLYTIAHTADQVVSYAPKRAIKSSKTFVVSSASLDRVPLKNPGFDRVLGHPLEIVPVTNPVTPMGPGELLKVRVLYKGKPLAGARVSFIPRGVRMSEGFDERYERNTDPEGLASYEVRDANYYLIAVHHEDTSEKGEGYESTKYGATMCVIVPAICPCCE